MGPSDFRRIRKDLGLTQAQLALRLDMGLRQLSALENGTRPIPRKYEFALRWVAWMAREKAKIDA